VPRAWLVPGAELAVAGLPTDLGPVDVRIATARTGRTEIAVSGVPSDRWRADLPSAP
jgi:hypothetical protein